MLSINLSLPVVKEASPVLITTPESVTDALKDIRNAAQEVFMVLTLDTKNYLIDRHVITIGTLNSTLIHPREIFRAAVLDGAAALVMVHNHPSGDPTPSAEDIRMTRQLVDAAKAMEINILDHVILGRAGDARNDYTSLRECGMVQFT